MAHDSQDEGTTIAETLFGDNNPGGHLVATWPKSLEQLPPSLDYNIRDGYTYMYFKGDPLYPFGYGLSYTRFKMNHLRVSAPSLARDGAVTVSVDVKNTGDRAGDEVVQLYVAHPSSTVDRPRKELKGFVRLHLQAHETKTAQIPLKASTLAYWNAQNKQLEVEPETLRLMVGDSSADLKLTAKLSVK